MARVCMRGKERVYVYTGIMCTPAQEQRRESHGSQQYEGRRCVRECNTRGARVCARVCVCMFILVKCVHLLEDNAV